jgi:PTH1 family peptidyl-tRNA hydrolase
MVADELAQHYQTSFGNDKKLKSGVAKFEYRDEAVLITKPQTFMNLSGDSVRLVMDYYKVALEDVWVISDDLDLEFGTIRIRQGGSGGGHNGLKDIIQKCGEDFVRFRVGIKNDLLEKMPAEDFVLQRFNQEEAKQLPAIVSKASTIAIDVLENGVEHASHTLNKI